MASNSGIEWTDATWNCVSGCHAVSPGCAHCYAAGMTRRLEAMGQADYTGLTTDKHFNGIFRELPHRLDVPLRWRKPRRVFVNSMSDLFGEGVSDEFIAAVFGVMAACPLHTFQVLTKRATRMHNWFAKINDAGGLGPYIRSDAGRSALRGLFHDVQKTEVVDGERQRTLDDAWMQVMNAAACHFGRGPLPNVQLGVSAEDQARADERIPWLLRTPAAVRFVSAEPLLGPIDLELRLQDAARLCCRNRKPGNRCPAHDQQGFIDWIIVGGESGPGARQCNIAWIRSIVAQCKAAGVACFVKQLGRFPFCGDCCDSQDLRRCAKCAASVWATTDRKGGEPAEWPEDLRVREFPSA